MPENQAIVKCVISPLIFWTLKFPKNCLHAKHSQTPSNFLTKKFVKLTQRFFKLSLILSESIINCLIICVKFRSISVLTILRSSLNLPDIANRPNWGKSICQTLISIKFQLQILKVIAKRDCRPHVVTCSELCGTVPQMTFSVLCLAGRICPAFKCTNFWNN